MYLINFKLVVLFLVVAQVIATNDVPAVGKMTNVVEKTWSEFKTLFTKIYTQGTEQARRVIFQANQAFIKKHNDEFHAGKHTYELGTNKYSDMVMIAFYIRFLIHH